VSNELSNYRDANWQPRLDDPGSFRAPGTGIDAHLGCFTPKRSLVRTQYRPLISALVRDTFRASAAGAVQDTCRVGGRKSQTVGPCGEVHT
jgi:hypothetical protein